MLSWWFKLCIFCVHWKMLLQCVLLFVLLEIKFTTTTTRHYYTTCMCLFCLCIFVPNKAIWSSIYRIHVTTSVDNDCIHSQNLINSLKPSDAYMRHQPRSSLVQILACRVIGAKPLSEPILYYCQLDPKEQTSVKLYSNLRHFHSGKRTWKCRVGNVGHFVSAAMCFKHC